MWLTGELLLACYELFQNHPQIGESYQEKFKYVLVDEFRPSDLQYKWLKYIGEVHRTVFAVGDDDQCLLSGTPVNIPDGKMNIERVIIKCKSGCPWKKNVNALCDPCLCPL